MAPYAGRELPMVVCPRVGSASRLLNLDGFMPPDTYST